MQRPPEVHDARDIIPLSLYRDCACVPDQTAHCIIPSEKLRRLVMDGGSRVAHSSM